MKTKIKIKSRKFSGKEGEENEKDDRMSKLGMDRKLKLTCGTLIARLQAERQTGQGTSARSTEKGNARHDEMMSGRTCSR